MLANALLVRWYGGWAERVDASSVGTYGRREALLGLGAVQSVEECYRIADQQLAIYQDIRTQITADLVPVDDDDTPYLSFLVGDTITVPDIAGTGTAERVMALTVTEDEDGNVTYAPELKDVILGAQERFAENLKKMADGTIRGDSKVATPVASIDTAGATCCPPAPPGGG